MKDISKKIAKNEIRQRISEESTVFSNPDDVVSSWADVLNLKKENSQLNIKGLRNPQIGAIHATLSHWTCSNDLGTIVMPTGTGKTETMISLLVLEQIPKLLILVPTDPLRQQISNKVATFGMLPTLGLLDSAALHPIVGIVKKNFSDVESAKMFFQSCNVIVATASILSRFKDDIVDELKNVCTHVFIDEAHHSEAYTWFKFKDRLKDKRILQFTATPYRNDDKKIGGKIIYNYPLKKAQLEGYFKPISFVKIYEYSSQKVDLAIANKATDQLRLDKKKYPHILLARVGNTKRADEVYEIYKNYSEFTAVKIHSNLSVKEKKDVYNRIIEKKVDIIVCVDMLGEGFDLPELKIAAFHDIRKSLPITLQFVGRFTRTKFDEELGNATIIANLADLKVKDELDDLYSKDVDWNLLLPSISEQRTQKEIDYYKFIEGFNDTDNFLLSLQNLKPAQSTVIFKNNSNTWFPTNYEKGIPALDEYDVVRHTINPDEKTLVILTAKKQFVDWANNDQIFDFSWNLYIIYWETQKNLLFIHSSDNGSLHTDLAKAIIGDTAEIISGDNGGSVFKVLSGIQRFKLQNVGLTEVLGKLIRFVMRVGSDIEPALSQTQIRKAKKAMIFGAGYENGEVVTIGCSYKGRIWSRRTTNLEAFVRWCKNIGKKVTDKNIDAEEVLRGTLVSKSLSKRPNLFPICVDWNESVYRQSETKYSFIVRDVVYELYNSSLVLVNPSEHGNIQFGLEVDDEIVFQLELELFTNDQGYNDFRFIKRQPSDDVYVSIGTKAIKIEDYFYNETPTIWFANGDSLEGDSYIELKSLITPYNANQLIVWDWTGIDLKKESQGVNPKIQNSIQYKCIEELKNKDYDIIYDDDGSGEIADVIAIKLLGDKISVELYHLKFAKDGKVSKEIKNLYEVCGQTQKSVNWKFKDEKEFFEHLLRREVKKEKLNTTSRFEKGKREDVINIIDLVKNRIPTEFKVFIVQPGVSKSNLTESQLTLLAVTENYLIEKSLIPLQVIVSA